MNEESVCECCEVTYKGYTSIEETEYRDSEEDSPITKV